MCCGALYLDNARKPIGRRRGELAAQRATCSSENGWLGGHMMQSNAAATGVAK
jgi:hypothetical protein